MSLQTRARGLLQKHAPAPIKRLLWDREAASGKWACLADGRTHHPEVERYAAGGSILDLGCGPGRTGLDLTLGTFARYLGVDISQVFITEARQRAAGRPELQYAYGDLLTFVPPHRMDVILLGDSLYYVPLSKLGDLLAHYRPFLSERGVFVVRVCDAVGKYQPLLNLTRVLLTTVIADVTVINGDQIPVTTIVGQ
jgi:SAM-dependent methyltransferase